MCLYMPQKLVFSAILHQTPLGVFYQPVYAGNGEITGTQDEIREYVHWENARLGKLGVNFPFWSWDKKKWAILRIFILACIESQQMQQAA